MTTQHARDARRVRKTRLEKSKTKEAKNSSARNAGATDSQETRTEVGTTTTRTRRLEKSKEDFQGEAIVRHVNDRTKHYDNDSQVEWRPKYSRGMDLQVHSSMYLEDSGRSSLYESDQGGIRERIAY